MGQPERRRRRRGLPKRAPHHNVFSGTHQRHKLLYGDPIAGRFSPKTHPLICAIEGCDRPYRAKGLCSLTYRGQWRVASLA